MANGILIVDKPAGWTSHDVVAKLRGALHERHTGHGGTLDPMATGVLPVFAGRATRAVEYFEAAHKEYIATLRLGLITNTDDITGETLAVHPVCVSKSQLQDTLLQFLGPQEQLPPMYSAVKVGGQKLYELARAGKTVARKPRSITVFALDLLSFDGTEASLRIRCSKGTYIRTLCRDIGDALGCGGTMAALRRTQAGVYSIGEAHTMEEILSLPDPAALLLPVDSLFSDYAEYQISDPAQERRCRNGTDFVCNVPDGVYRVYSAKHAFLMLGQSKGGTMQTLKSFFEVN